MNVPLLFILLLLTNCNQDVPIDGSTNNELLFFNGEIYTVNPNQEWADAIHVKDGVIEYVGTEEEAKTRASADAERIDLKGAFVMPGIHDVHQHPLEAASDNYQFTLEREEETAEDYAAKIEDAVLKNPNLEWILGWGHDLAAVLNTERNPKEILDEIEPNRPLGVMEKTSHSFWCNSKALELLEYDANSPDPKGGIIMRDETGEPNGVLIDNAGEKLLALALAPTSQRAQNDYDGLVEFALPELAKHGITSISEARTYWKRNHQETWKKIAEDNKLTVRVNLGLWVYPTADDDTQITAIKSLFSNDVNSLLRINQIKLYSDGIIHNTTAAMHDDYIIDYFSKANNNGLNYIDQDRLAKYITELEPTGFDFHIHALGNRAVHESLNAIEQSGSSKGRHRLTHVEYVDPADLPRFAQLNVTADAQVVGDFTQPIYWSDNDYLIGSALNQNNIPLKSLAKAQVRITLSSDWDVSSLNPFVGLQNAVTREPQNITLEEAIRAYTINAAYVMRQEDKVGSIEVGKEADLIVLDRNPFDISPNQIARTKVLETYLQGELIYER